MGSCFAPDSEPIPPLYCCTILVVQGGLKRAPYPPGCLGIICRCTVCSVGRRRRCSLPLLWRTRVVRTRPVFAFCQVVEGFYTYVFTKPKSSYGKDTQLGITFASGYLAGVICAIVSHPADTVVSKVRRWRFVLRRSPGGGTRAGNGENTSPVVSVVERGGEHGRWKNDHTGVVPVRCTAWLSDERP